MPGKGRSSFSCSDIHKTTRRHRCQVSADHQLSLINLITPLRITHRDTGWQVFNTHRSLCCLPGRRAALPFLLGAHPSSTRRHIHDGHLLVVCRYAEYTFITDEQISASASVHSRYNSDSLRGVIIDIFLLSRTDYLVCTFSSQVRAGVMSIVQQHELCIAGVWCHTEKPMFYIRRCQAGLTSISWQSHQVGKF